MSYPENEVMEVDVVLPPRSSKPRSYPALYTMDVNQSFTKPAEEYRRLHNAAQMCRKATGRLFAIRKLQHEQAGYIRIWRTA